MPELPEVETFRKKIEKALKGKVVKDVDVRPDKLIFAGKSPAAVKKIFLGAKVKKCRRKGKYIWFEMNHKLSPVFHLGMTGSYIISNELPDKSLKSVKLILEMNDGTFLIYKDPRRFGRIFILENPLDQKPLKNLGPDVMNELPSVKWMEDVIKKRTAPIKGLLLDQSLFAGIGNWMADEILYQSGIAPHRPSNQLTPREIKKLHDKIKSVTELSVRVGADDERYPKSWLFHHRWGRRAKALEDGEKIEHSTVAGRSTAWVPTRQK